MLIFLLAFSFYLLGISLVFLIDAFNDDVSI
jgi:hypothetical protein